MYSFNYRNDMAHHKVCLTTDYRKPFESEINRQPYLVKKDDVELKKLIICKHLLKKNR